MMEVMRADLYETIYRRRDVRAQFTGAPIEDEALRRVLSAAQLLSSDSHRLKLEVHKFLETVRAA